MPVLWIIFKLQSGWSLKLLYEKHYTGWNETNHPRKASYTAVFFLCFWRGQTSGLWDLMFLHSQLIWLELLLQVTGSFTVRSMKGWWRGSFKGNHRRGLFPPFHNTHTHTHTLVCTLHAANKNIFRFNSWLPRRQGNAQLQLRNEKLPPPQSFRASVKHQDLSVQNTPLVYPNRLFLHPENIHITI